MGARASCNPSHCCPQMDEIEDDHLAFAGGIESMSVLDWGRGVEPVGQVFEETLGQLDVLDRQLLVFCATSSLAAVRWLQLLGASLDAQDANGSTCLHVACRSGALAVVMDVLQHDVLLETTDCACWTPLHIAAHIGRREAVVRLLQAKASPQRRNARCQTAAELCMDQATLEVLRGAVPPVPWGSGAVEDTVGIPLKCEPECFFVSPTPIIRCTLTHKKPLLQIACLIFKQQPSYGLAFVVLSGVADSYTGAMRTFLQQGEAHRARLGDFLGEGFSLCTLIRFSVFDSMPLLHTGIVSALSRVFSVIQLPQDLQKIDRLVRGLAHVWWRKHKAIAESGPEPPKVGRKREGEGELTELSGLELKQYLAGSDALCQLMLSSILLHWYIHRDRKGGKKALGIKEWVAMNRGIENGGTDVPEHVQVRVHAVIAHHFRAELALAPEQDKDSEDNYVRLPPSSPQKMSSLATQLKQVSPPEAQPSWEPDEAPMAAITPSPRDEVRVGLGAAVLGTAVLVQPPEPLEPEEPPEPGPVAVTPPRRSAAPRQPTPGGHGLANGREGDLPVLWRRQPAAADKDVKSALSTVSVLEGWVKPLDGAIPLPAERSGGAASRVGICEYAAPSGMAEVFTGGGVSTPRRPGVSRVPEAAPREAQDGSIWASLCCIFLFFSMRPQTNASGAPFALLDARRLRVANVCREKCVITLQGISPRAENEQAPVTLVVLLSDGRWQETQLKKLEIRVPTAQELNAWVAHLVQWPSSMPVSV